MSKELKFIDSLGVVLGNRAQRNIQSNLLCEFYDQIEQNQDIDGDHKFATMSDIPEVMEAFNKFYNLAPTDREYLS